MKRGIISDNHKLKIFDPADLSKALRLAGGRAGVYKTTRHPRKTRERERRGGGGGYKNTSNDIRHNQTLSKFP